MRINKFLAGCGLGSRRKMDQLVAAGRVSVNGQQVQTAGLQIDPQRDDVLVDGKPVNYQSQKQVYLLNKPVGYLTTMSDPQGRKTVADFVGEVPFRLFPVGRLDMDTSGLLLFTNDGGLAHRLAHPSFGVEKEYRVKVRGRLTSDKIHRLESGVLLEEGRTSPAEVCRTEFTGNFSVFHLVLHEGWKRQVRRMCDAVGLPVIALQRVRYAFLSLDGVDSGQLRLLSDDEYATLLDLCNMDKKRGDFPT